MTGPMVTISGAGPTGLAAAIALRRLGAEVRIIDRSEGPIKESRAVGVNARSMALLTPCGAARRLEEIGEPVRRLRLFDSGRPLAALDVPGADRTPPQVTCLPQSETERILNETLQGLGVAVEWGVRATGLGQDDSGARLRIEGPDGHGVIAGDYLLGADGSRSVIRKALGIDFPGERYPETWSLLDAELDWPWPDAQAAAFFNPDGAVLFIVTLGNGRHRVISTHPDAEDRVRAKMAINAVSWRNEFTVSLRLAENHGFGRVWIAGDAAHVHSPVGGMGMNLGIEDGFDFAESIISGDLENYAKRRHAAGERVLRVSDRGFRVVTAKNPVLRGVRNIGLRALGRSGFLRRRLFSAMAGGAGA